MNNYSTHNYTWETFLTHGYQHRVMLLNLLHVEGVEKEGVRVGSIRRRMRWTKERAWNTPASLRLCDLQEPEAPSPPRPSSHERVPMAFLVIAGSLEIRHV